MSFGRSMNLFALLEMAPMSPSMQDSDSSREGSPMFDPLNLPKPKATANLHSPLLKLPDDIFKCIMDYLDRDAAWSLKRLCKGMANSETVNQLLYKYPIQLNDVRDIRLGDWKYRSVGLLRWQSFKESINASNRKYVHKLAMSHWASIDDFRWIEDNLPALASLDISAIKDFVWTPEETWTWKMLAEACPKLFARLEELEVANWADYTAHSRIEYSYSYNDYRFKQKFRISRRRDGGSVANMIFPICNKLRTLAIRERYSGFHAWNEWEVHQRVCCLVDGVQKYCPSSMTKLRVHDYAPYRSLFSTDATAWSRLTDVEIGLYSWMEDRRDRDVIGPIPYRITQGHHHRDEEEAFDDKTFDNCERDHMALGNHVVQGVGASFEDLLQSLQTISNKYPKINIKPIRNLQNITLHPFHLVNVMQRRHHFGQNTQNNDQASNDPSSKPEVQEALRWLAQKCDWKPILAWDSMMCDVFPANLEPNRTFLPKPDVVSRIQKMVSTLRGLNIPIRISIGDRTNTCPSSGLDGSLYFGDYKTFVGDDENKREVLLPTQASFSLMTIASMVDELTIQYPVDVPGVSGWLRAAKRPTPAEKALMQREMVGWRRFWARYASQFKNLKKLTANVPNDIYDDWGKGDLAVLLADERWQMLEVEERGGDYGFFGSYFPFSSSSVRYSFSRKRSRTKFVQRVFFRLDDRQLDLTTPNAQLSDQEREEMEITEEQIKDGQIPSHRFWSTKDEEKCEKRKRVEEGTEGQDKQMSKRQKVEQVE
ncbi:Nn.00g114510.m01.CDS01 [Neocucurbitaria sp. VM-36]